MTILPKPRTCKRSQGAAYDVAAIRADFPILAREVNGKPLVYLDNGASAQKPKRGAGYHPARLWRRIRQRPSRAALSQQPLHRQFREGAGNGAPLPQCALRRRDHLHPQRHRGDQPRRQLLWRRRISARATRSCSTIMEHHSNIVPWHFLQERQGAVLKWAPISDDGEFLLDKFEALTQPAHQDGRHHPHVERARHHRAAQGGGADRARARHPGAGRRRPRRRASPGRRAGPRLSISMPSPATSSTARPASACSTARRSCLRRMPPYQGGGEMIGT